MTTKSNY